MNGGAAFLPVLFLLGRATLYLGLMILCVQQLPVARADSNRDLVLRGTVRLATGGDKTLERIHRDIRVEARLPDGRVVAEGSVSEDGKYSFLVQKKHVSTDLTLRVRHAQYVSRTDIHPIVSLQALSAQSRSTRVIDFTLVLLEDRFVSEIKRIEQELQTAVSNREIRPVAAELLILEKDFLPTERSEEFRYRIVTIIAETIHKIASERLNTTIPQPWIDHLLSLSTEAWPSNLQLRRQASLFALAGRALSSASKTLERDDDFGMISSRAVTYLASAIDNDWHRTRTGDATAVSQQPYLDLIDLASRKRQHQTCVTGAQLFLDRADIRHTISGTESRKSLLLVAIALSDCLAKETRRLSLSDDDYISRMAGDPIWGKTWDSYGPSLEKYAPYFVNGKSDVSLQLERDLVLWRRIKSRAQ